MNNKGQVLVLFVLIIPLLLLLGAYIVDTAYISYYTNQLNGLNSLVINEARKQELTIPEIEAYIRKNDSNVEIETLNVTNTEIEIILKKEIKSLFGIVIGKKSYILTSNKNIKITNSDLPLYQ